MLGDILRFLLEITFNLFGSILITRTWIYAMRLHPLNPFASAIYQITDWIILPIKKIIFPGKIIDWSSLFASWLVALIYLTLILVVSLGNPVPPNLISRLIVVSIITISKWILNLTTWLILAQAIISWINPMSPIMSLLKMLTAPLLDPVRRSLPNTTIDFSPIIVLFLTQIGLMILTRLVFSLLML